MKLGKAIFVTVLIAVLLAAIDVCFYMLCINGFAVLTGLIAIYGFLRGSFDLCNWLRKADPAPASAEGSDNPSAQHDPARAAAMMRVLDEDL